MQGEGIQVIDQLTSLIALALMLGMASSLGAAYSPKSKNNPGVDNPGGQAELLKKFMELNPEAQRGAISYIEKMRKGYKKGA